VGHTIDRLRSAGLLDDQGFAQNWVESRDQRAPRSRRLTAAELRARGVASAIVEGVTATIDEQGAAYRAAERRARSLSALPYVQFRQRIGGLLLRRGFDYDVVRETVRKLWSDSGRTDDSG
jgi:regulatory protein